MAFARKTTMILTAAVLASASGQGNGAKITRQEFPNAGAVCQGALPSYAGTLRTRPLGIMNEAATPAFVTCSFNGGMDPSAPTTNQIAVVMVNRNASPLQVACTLVNGYEFSSVSAQYVPKTITLAASGSGAFTFVPADLPNGVSSISNPNVSCQLPGGTGITFVGQRYEEEIGN